ncbi:MAG: DUF1385 domain-containing protein [Nitrospiraceae bacterium]|nr:DUF1385 domain-containing protein [Nitrospiraceae bacterium]
MQAIGGQAVIEGVMFKSRRGWAVAVRGQDGSIRLKLEPLTTHRSEKVPLLRGTFILFYTLLLGIRALEFSAQVSSDEEKPVSPLAMGLTLFLSFAVAIGLFLFLPLYLTRLIGFIFPLVAKTGWLFNLVDGLIRVGLFLLYIGIVGLWKEMARVFEYHGAEHKVIHAYEAGELSMERIKAQSPRHPRCGTSFLLIVMVVSILVFSFIPQHWPLYFKFLSRIVLIPFVAGISYETLKLSAKYQKNPLMRLLVLPGLALQRLTTREPDEKQLEVSLRAFKEVMSLEGPNETA